jgi:hypothetical protein
MQKYPQTYRQITETFPLQKKDEKCRKEQEQRRERSD